MANDNKNPKLFLGQNMSARARSPLFWTGIVGILGSAVVSFGGLIGVDLSTQVDSVTANSSKIIEAVFLVLGLMGVSVDPTSKKYRDSGIAQTYKKPRNDEDVSEYVKWETDANEEKREIIKQQEQIKQQMNDDTDEENNKQEKQEQETDENKEIDAKDAGVAEIAPERKEKKVEDFDTNQPFSDDSDEVEYDVSEYDYGDVPKGGSALHDDEPLEITKEKATKYSDEQSDDSDGEIASDEDANHINDEDEKVVKEIVVKEEIKETDR